MSFSSSLPFCSFLQYSPKGEGSKGQSSLNIRTAIKFDGTVAISRPDGSKGKVNAIDQSVNLLTKAVKELPFLARCFGREVILVPVPRSAPLSSKDALWPSHRICRALIAQGLGADIAPVIERHKPVQKASFAEPGKRPLPSDHFASTRIVQAGIILPGRKITLVDDFVTRGSSFLGLVTHLERAFPECEIHCFALVRTQSFEPVEKIVAPVEGLITFDGTRLKRSP